MSYLPTIEHPAFIDKKDSQKVSPSETMRILEEASSEELFHAPGLVSISLRRHGEYGPEGTKNYGRLYRSQETGKDTYQDTLEVANDWLQKLPRNSEVTITNSPSFMPQTFDLTDDIRRPARARMTAGMYEVALSRHAGPELASRDQDRRLGDIFEFHDPDTNESVVPFFIERSKHYGKDKLAFFKDYLKDELPDSLQAKFEAAGGISSRDRAAMVVDWLKDNVQNDSDGSRKQVRLGLSHEESIGSLVYQLGEMLKTDGAQDRGEQLQAEALVGFNGGFDIHAAPDGTMALVDQKGNKVVFDLEELSTYLSGNTNTTES